MLNSMPSDKERQATIRYRRREDLETCLHRAAGQNHLHFVRFLLGIIKPDHKMLIATNRDGENALMKAASVSALRVTKHILEKVKEHNPKFLDQMLRETSYRKKGSQTALRYAIKSPNHNSRRCAQIIISHYNQAMDISSTFLSYLEIGDTLEAGKLWAKVQDDAKQRKELIETTDADGYNCFLIASRNGDYRSLKWLLSLNDEKEDEKEEDERNVMLIHEKTGETPLLICVSHDVRKKVDGEKELTDEEKQSYYRCVTAIFETVTEGNKDNLLKEKAAVKGDTKRDSIAWCCFNGNMETAEYLLSQASKGNKGLRKRLMAHYERGHPYFIDAIRGGNVDLIRLIHDEYIKSTMPNTMVNLRNKEMALETHRKNISQIQRRGLRDKEKRESEAITKRDILEDEVKRERKSYFRKIERELLRETTALHAAFEHGVMEIADWILNELIDDPKIRMQYLNRTINKCKEGRKTEDRAQEIINKILDGNLGAIHGQKEIINIRNIFQFLMKRDPVDINGVRTILNKLSRDEDTKRIWFKEVKCLKYAGKLYKEHDRDVEFRKC